MLYITVDIKIVTSFYPGHYVAGHYVIFPTTGKLVLRAQRLNAHNDNWLLIVLMLTALKLLTFLLFIPTVKQLTSLTLSFIIQNNMFPYQICFLYPLLSRVLQICQLVNSNHALVSFDIYLVCFAMDSYSQYIYLTDTNIMIGIYFAISLRCSLELNIYSSYSKLFI